MIDQALLAKYNVPVPRYTSYPTVPYWNETIEVGIWKENFISQFHKGNKKDGISLYIHLPFCESLCTYCGCNKKITTNHNVENEYIKAIKKEWDLYVSLMNETPIIRELHLGGGTPTFFSPKHLEELLFYILGKSIVHAEHEFSFEGHPNNTTIEHLQTLYNIGFRRVSFGVQDNDPEVQRIINRIQPFENVKKATEAARRIGYKSVNFDLIYGLPKQTMESIRNTIIQTISLLPDRVAFYSYAHVPWTSKGQRLFDENDLPGAKEKLDLYIAGKTLFLEHGYHDIGMDHFALENDDLYKAQTEGRLHRNFMGYTTQNSAMLIGLGVSAISDTGNAYAQNIKTVHDYYEYINADVLPVQKGYFHTHEDISFRKYILDISCKGKTVFSYQDMSVIKKYVLPKLLDIQDDGLFELSEDTLELTSTGKHFIRNICSAFDLYLVKSTDSSGKKPFSKAI